MVNKIHGRLFNPNEASFLSAEMWRDDEGDYWLESAVDPAAKVTVSIITPAVGKVPVLITLSDGRRFETQENFAKNDRFFQQNIFERWIENFSLKKTVVIFLLIFAFFYGFRLITPVIADVALYLVPVSVDVSLGDTAEEALEGIFFTETELEQADQDSLYALYQELSDGTLQKQGFHPKLLLRKSEPLGANAVALPNGTMIVTDDLWLLMKDHPDEVQAVIVHEMMHVHKRHGMRQMLRYGLLSLLAFVIGVEESSFEELLLIFTHFSQSGYSREFEKEADHHAAKLMLAKDLDPMALSRALGRLTLTACGEEGCPEGGWFASHPDFPERHSLIEQASDHQH